jgi:metalloendopeptidase OMA1, mitochondrial
MAGVGPGVNASRSGQMVRFAVVCCLVLALTAVVACGFPLPPEFAPQTSQEQGGEGQGPGGREQPLALTPEQELKVGRRAYKEVMSEVRAQLLPDGSPEVARVRHIMERIVKASEIEPLQREIHLRVAGYRFEWEANVIRDRQVNAFCLPAGKMFVFTGILDVVANDDQLATVLSHEAAHALAHHASERVAREQRGDDILRSLRYDREQETEADHIGLFLMTFAGYDPGQAVAFWQRMHEAQGRRGRQPEILSDHPSDERRIQDMREWVPKARAAKQAFDEGRIAPPGR